MKHSASSIWRLLCSDFQALFPSIKTYVGVGPPLLPAVLHSGLLRQLQRAGWRQRRSHRSNALLARTSSSFDHGGSHHSQSLAAETQSVMLQSFARTRGTGDFGCSGRSRAEVLRATEPNTAQQRSWHPSNTKKRRGDN